MNAPLVEQLADGTSIVFDTNALIYYVEEHDRYFDLVAPFIQAVVDGRLEAHASLINLTEVLVLPLREGRADLAERYRQILRLGFHLHHIDEALANQAAAVAAKYGLKTADAIVCATAIQSGCRYLLTNDPKLRRIEELRVLVLDDSAKS